MSDLANKARAWDEVAKKNAIISRLATALNDIAMSEPIPTPIKGWEFCRDVALDVLSEFPELSAAPAPLQQDQTHG
jgi:hypothetical protein